MVVEIKLKRILCNDCIHFKDTGLKEFIQYDRRKTRVKARIQVRFFCDSYREYLGKLYSLCKKFESRYLDE